MAENAPATSVSRGYLLRRFVAYSLLAHLGAGIGWGVPALLGRVADQELAQHEKALAEHFRKEEVKTKEHVEEQRIEHTRREVEQELRKEFDKLTAKLSEPRRDELWEEVAAKTETEAEHFAAALGNLDAPEQDLRTLEAELRRAMIEELNRELTTESARGVADRFLDLVESQVAPDLAKVMQDEVDKRVADQMRNEAEMLIQDQRAEAQKASEEALGSLREAATKADAAKTATKQISEQLAKATANAAKADELLAKSEPAAQQAGEKAKLEAGAQIAAAGTQARQAVAQLAEADASFDRASAVSAPLDGTVREQVAAADRALDAAKTAMAKAASAVQGKSPDAAAAVTAAQDATTALQQATTQAMNTISGQTDRADIASAAVRAAAHDELSKQVAQAVTDELTKTTLPRLSGKLREAFKKQLEQAGMSDDALVTQVGQEINEHLAKSVPALAKASEQAVAAKLGDVGPAAKGAAATIPKRAGHGHHGGGGGGPAAKGAAAPQLGNQALDQALSAGLAAIGANATKHVAEVAAGDSQDGRLVQQATNGLAGTSTGAAPAGGAATSESDVAAMADLRDSVGALARSMGNGRVGGGGGIAIGVLRESALARRNTHSRNEATYQEIAGKIADRGAVSGEKWVQRGATGATSRASAVAGNVPARVVGQPASTAKPRLSNDQPYAPTFKSLAFTTVPYLNREFRIDGNLAKWDAMPAIELKPEHGGEHAKQVMKLAWSNAGLFVFYRITDPNRHLDKAEVGSFYNADVAEVWVDAYNTKEKFRARHIGQQFWIWPAGSASDSALTGGESVKVSKGGDYFPTGLRADRLERWATQTADGWVMEARLSAQLIADADLSAGRILGFNAYITTKGGEPGWYWSAGKSVHTFGQPDTWGDLLLAGSDARIEVLSGHEDAGKHVALVGEPLRLRVTDGDMDLDPTSRDKVMVTLKDTRGGQQIAVLEETGLSTGVFDGAVSTALALDEAVPAVLGVYEGERVEIAYVDQARANGARGAKVSTGVSFGAVVMAMGVANAPASP